MAVETQEKGVEFRGRQVRFGTNVAMATVLVIAIVAVLQWGGYRFGGKSDWTSSSVNSLSEGTQNLLTGLATKVRITSAYFETDLEGEDQEKFRQAVRDLANLFQIENRADIECESFNPLQDHDKRKALLDRVAAKPKFQEQSVKHREMIAAFHDDVLPQISTLLSTELDTLSGLVQGLTGQGGGMVLPQIEDMLEKRQRALTVFQEEIDGSLEDDIPRYSNAVSLLRTLYTSTSKELKDIGSAGKQVATSGDGLTQAQNDYLAGAEERYRPLVNKLDEAVTNANDLPRLDLDDLVRQLGADANAIVVETDQDAKVLGFNDVWPPLDPGMPSASVAFKDRAFRGEEKLASAILQLTTQEKTAVIFVKYGGPPLFFGGFGMGQQAVMAKLKTHLEDMNFEVREWDLSKQMEPPEIDPAPSRTIYVLLKPESPPPMMQQQAEQFGPQHAAAVTQAINESGRALFVAGWYPGAFGAMPSTYEYGQYLSDKWGIDVNAGVLLLQATPVGPGEFRLGRTAMYMLDSSSADDPIVNRLGVLRALYPFVSPLDLSSEPPEGVDLEKLVWVDPRDGLWGAKDVQKYVEQTRNEYQVKVEGDLDGPFTVAAKASKGDDKVVVVSSRDFCVDEMAYAMEAALTAEGITLRSRNPGNLTLLVNSLHWLNDNEQIMNLCRPLDVATLEIEEGPTLSFLRVLAWGIWPAVAMICGGAVWYVRRR